MAELGAQLGSELLKHNKTKRNTFQPKKIENIFLEVTKSKITSARVNFYDVVSQRCYATFSFFKVTNGSLGTILRHTTNFNICRTARVKLETLPNVNKCRRNYKITKKRRFINDFYTIDKCTKISIDTSELEGQFVAKFCKLPNSGECIG